MAYVGGKARGSDHILRLLNSPQFDGMNYLEPFVGYAHILRRVVNKKSYYASDINPLLITLLDGIRKGKRPPNITPEEYAKLKKRHNEVTFRRAIAGFAYSYKGMQFVGYFDKRRNRSYAEEHKRYYETLRRSEIVQHTNLRAIDYRNIKPRDMLIYCDPPYRNTTQYNSQVFNTDEFWQKMREWSKHNIVFISEYNAPTDFKQVAKFHKFNNLLPTGKPVLRVERVFVHKSLLTKLAPTLKVPTST